MKKKIKLLFILSFLKAIFISIFVIPSILFGQDEVLLEPNELQGFELRSESKWDWIIGNGSQTYLGVCQEWQLSGNQDPQFLYIYYFELPTIPLAILGASYQVRTKVNGYIWKSPTYHIVGEDTWCAVFTPEAVNSYSSYFTKTNVAIQIFTPFFTAGNFNSIFNSVSSKILEKIDLNYQAFINSEISDSVAHAYEESTQFINKLVPEPNNHIEKISVWIMDSTHYRFGVRNEYVLDSATFGVDLCVFNSESDATRSAGIQADICSISGKVFDMNDPDLYEKFQSEWDYYLNSVSAENTFSMILAGGKTLVHLYGFNMKPAHFDQMNALLNEITFAVLKNSWSVEIPQESYLLEQNRPNPFFQSTIIEYCIPYGSENSSIYLYDRQGKKQKTYPLPPGGRSELFIDSSNLQSGIYFYSLIIDGQAKGTKQMVRVN